MKFLKSKIAWQLLVWLLVIEFPVECLLVYVSYHNAENTLKTELTEKLRAIATYQIAEINDYVEEQLHNVNTLAQLPEIITTAQWAVNNHQKTDYDKLSTTHQADLQKYQDIFSLKDVLLVAPDGKVLLSTEPKINIGTNLAKGELNKTKLHRVFSRANIILQTDFSDFFYLPHSNNQLVAFIATPIFDTTKKPIGVLVAGINLEKLTREVRNYTGMGKTGEILLVTKMDKEALFVVPTRYQQIEEPLKKIALNDESKGGGIKNALNAESGYGIVKDYLGKEVFAHWHYVPALRSGLVIKEETAEAFEPIVKLRNILSMIVIATLLLFVFAAFNIAKIFTRPIRKLNEVTKKMAAGDLTQRVNEYQNNEIGELAHSFDDMAAKIQEANLTLELRVQERTEELHTTIEELSQTNEELHSTVEFVETQKKELTKKNDNIVASITYARRIQAAILPLHEDIAKKLKDFFIFYQPRDIVSGDFYWFAELKNNTCLMAAADCTGHGVPGALMSMIGVNLLNEIVYLMDIHSPDQILERMQIEINRVLQQSVTDNRDGMDISLCHIDLDNKKIDYAGAMNSIYYVQNEKLHEIKATRTGIGGTTFRSSNTFAKHTIDIQEPTVLYMFSDGYADQIGGKENRKFMSKNFKNLLLSVHNLYTEMQHENIKLTMKEWMDTEPQLDDMMVIGIKL
jgi:serine phosphatase RsbU (regulator of sigma subunit)